MKRALAITAMLASIGYVGGAMGAPLLPAPGTPVNGIIPSAQYDDGWSYPTRLLEYLYPTAGWDSAAGTGTLDVLITTRSSGQKNPLPFPDPVTNPNTSPIMDSWGTAATTGNLLVKDVRNWLLTNFNTTVPQFTFDQNETGGNPDLFVSAKVEIIDGAGGPVLHTWAFDNPKNRSCLIPSA